MPINPDKLATCYKEDIEEMALCGPDGAVHWEHMSVSEAFDLWMSYQGIIGYSNRILDLIEQLKKAELT